MFSLLLIANGNICYTKSSHYIHAQMRPRSRPVARNWVRTAQFTENTHPCTSGPCRLVYYRCTHRYTHRHDSHDDPDLLAHTPCPTPSSSPCRFPCLSCHPYSTHAHHPDDHRTSAYSTKKKRRLVSSIRHHPAAALQGLASSTVRHPYSCHSHVHGLKMMNPPVSGQSCRMSSSSQVRAPVQIHHHRSCCDLEGLKVQKAVHLDSSRSWGCRTSRHRRLPRVPVHAAPVGLCSCPSLACRHC